MLKSWSIKNFKPIVDSGELQLAPVTVFAGRNSSGKSSLLQSILMIAQTLGNRLQDRPLLPNERIVQLGTFESILSEFSDLKTLTINFEIEFENEESLYTTMEEFYYLREPKGHYVKNQDLDVDEKPEEPEQIILTFPSNNEISQVSITFQGPNRTKRDLLPVAEATNIYISTASINVIPFGLDYRGHALMASSFNLHFRKVSRQGFNKIVKNLLDQKDLKTYEDIKTLDYIGKFQGTTYLLSLSHFLPRAMRKIPNEASRQEENAKAIERAMGFEVHDEESFLRHDFSDSIARIENFFTSKIRYLGPLRADPGVIQNQFAPTSELDDVGFRGEYAAIVYHTNKKALIDWYNPKSQQIENGALQLALDSWAQYLNVAEHIDTEIAGALGITWRITLKEGTKPRMLHEVGVGVSQVLPILIMGLLSPANVLLIIEQPELHLHPYVQARLGDFFMGLAKCKKQCLIETHSENLVSQLRLHVVLAGGLEKSDCMVYFADRDERGAAKFERIKISPNGNILNWPDGFFDETMLQEDRITAASLRKRAQEAKHD